MQKIYIKAFMLWIFISLTFSAQAWASGLKVFGPEFCSAHTANSCINFHYKTLKDAKNFFGKYKYPKGKAAYDRCAARISGTDGEYAYCSMLFHYAEQSDNERKQMCHGSVKNKYYDLASRYSFNLYLKVWKCG